jgi:hypothetical protein
MCPQRFVPPSFDPSKLGVLEQVFDSTWELIRLAYPNRDPSKDEEVRTELAKAIAAEACTGVSEPNVLCKLALKSLFGTGRFRQLRNVST